MAGGVKRQRSSCPFLVTKKRKNSMAKSDKVGSPTGSPDMPGSPTGNVLKSLSTSAQEPPRKKKAPKRRSSSINEKENEATSGDETESNASSRFMKAEVKQESQSREASVALSLSTRVDGVPDGRVKGSSLNKADRLELENNSIIHYSYPRISHHQESKRKFLKGRMLDLMQDGEVDECDLGGNGQYTMDSILAIDKESVLIMWAGYKFPTWEHKYLVTKGSELTEFTRRMKILDSVFHNIISSDSGSFGYWNFIRNYPNCKLNQTMDYSEYVKHPGIVYLSGLRKRERQISDFRDEFYGKSSDDGPTLIFEDWTDFQSSYIPSFEYIIDSQLSEEAAAVEKNLLWNKQCCSCESKCDQIKGCCDTKSASNLGYMNKGRLVNTGKSRKDDDEDEFGVLENSPNCVEVYECGDECTCDKACVQRVLQLGRLNKLVCFNHHEKGWTLRAGNDLASGAFVCEYVGMMVTAKEAASDQTYQLELNVKTKGGRNIVRTMVIDAMKKGNEGRFIAHSCQPNLFTQRVHFDIEGRPKRHIGLFASRAIKAGEELTFDYYLEVEDPVEFHKRTKFACKCGAVECREKQYQSMLRKKMIHHD